METLDLSKLEKVKRQGNKIICRCPACYQNGLDSTGNHLAVFNDGRFGCVVDQSKIHYKQIYEYLKSGEINENENSFLDFDDSIILPKKFNKEILNHLNPDHSYWAARAIDISIFEKFNITSGIIDEEKLKNRHTTVIFNEKDEIIGFAGRSLNPKSTLKWKIIGDKRDFLFINQLSLEEITKTKTINLVESLGDYYSCLSAGIYNTIPMFGTNLSAKILKFLISNSLKNINIITNNDPVNRFGKRPGQDAAAKMKSLLSTLFDDNVINLIDPVYNDLNDAIKQAGSDFITNLLRERI